MSGGTRKPKLRVQQWQRLILEGLYERNQFPSEEESINVALETGLERPWIKNWFQKQRNNAVSAHLSARNTPTPLPLATTSVVLPSISQVLDSNVYSPSNGGVSSDDSRASSSIRSSTPITSEASFRSMEPALDIPRNGPPGLLSRPSTSIQSTALSSNQALFLPMEPFDLATLRSPAQSPSLGYIPTAFPVTFSGPIAPSGSFYLDAPQAHSEPGAEHGYLDFSTVLATAFPELAHVYRPSLAPRSFEDSFAQHPNQEIPFDFSFSSLQSHSTAILHPTRPRYSPPPPISYSARLSDITALACHIRKTHRERFSGTLPPKDMDAQDRPGDNEQDLDDGEDEKDKENVPPTVDDMNNNHHQADPTPECDDDGEQTGQRMHAASTDHKQIDLTTSLERSSPPRTAQKRSSNSRVLRSAKKLCQL